jgi:hypothetical protein
MSSLAKLGILVASLAAGACGGAIDDVGEPAAGEPTRVGPVLAGSRIVLHVPRAATVGSGDIARSSDEAVASVEVKTWCSCHVREPHRVSSRTVDLETSCGDGEERDCGNVVSLNAGSPGDVEITLNDTEGAVVERFEIEVRQVASMGFDVRLEDPDAPGRFESRRPLLAPAPDGAVEVPVGAVVQLSFNFRDADGRPLRFDVDLEESFRVSASGDTILEKLPGGFVAPGYPSRFRALRGGEAAVTLEGRGLTSEVLLRAVE